MKRMPKLFSALILAALLCLVALPAFAAVEDTGFADVDADSWYAEAVEYCRDNGLMSGKTTDTFAPNDTTSRAELVTVLYRQAGSPAVQTPATFADVPAGQWYSDAVAWAAQNDIISGYGDSLFGTDDAVTREQLSAILWRYEGSPVAEAGAAFADESQIADFAVTAVDWAQAQGIVSGRENNNFDPQGSAARSELAAMLFRWLSADDGSEQGSTQPQQPTTPQEPSDPQGSTSPDTESRVLVAYFSRTGTTADLAEAIAEITGGDLFEIQPVTPYPTDYNACLDQAQQEQSANARPAIANQVTDISQYDVVYLGFPIWYGNTPMIIRTFVEQYDLSGKTIAPFATSGSSGIGSSEAAIRTLAPNATVVSGLCITSSNTSRMDSLAADWVDSLNLD